MALLSRKWKTISQLIFEKKLMSMLWMHTFKCVYWICGTPLAFITVDIRQRNWGVVQAPFILLDFTLIGVKFQNKAKWDFALLIIYRHACNRYSECLYPDDVMIFLHSSSALSLLAAFNIHLLSHIASHEKQMRVKLLICFYVLACASVHLLTCVPVHVSVSPQRWLIPVTFASPSMSALAA